MSTQHHDHDDGLVHGHAWATEPARTPAPAPQVLINRPTEPDYDDGLVHGHDWACSERGRTAHRAA